MESQSPVEAPASRWGLGRCRHFFWLGVVFDIVGSVVLFTGVFSNLLFYDLLLYLGAIIIFLSLLWWIFWYTGNVEMPSEEKLLLRPPFQQHSIVTAFRQRVSHRFSATIDNVSTTIQRIAEHPCRRTIQRAAFPAPMATGQPEKGTQGEVPGNGDAQAGGGEQLSHEGTPDTKVWPVHACPVGLPSEHLDPSDLGSGRPRLNIPTALP
ncbi:PREDICTED: transmembrane protein 238-like [Elephantulus edwardii]|uniref:transmembrane protein 238-like n=1 Tax=Elephantulus edwardii TaxID=28737 RepID=UPI0003F0F012|nr:PREDICTED: transmembrane protein 238-like [Elephantulus edwardii]